MDKIKENKICFKNIFYWREKVAKEEDACSKFVLGQYEMHRLIVFGAASVQNVRFHFKRTEFWSDEKILDLIKHANERKKFFYEETIVPIPVKNPNCNIYYALSDYESDSDVTDEEMDDEVPYAVVKKNNVNNNVRDVSFGTHDNFNMDEWVEFNDSREQNTASSPHGQNSSFSGSVTHDNNNSWDYSYDAASSTQNVSFSGSLTHDNAYWDENTDNYARGLNAHENMMDWESNNVSSVNDSAIVKQKKVETVQNKAIKRKRTSHGVKHRERGKYYQMLQYQREYNLKIAVENIARRGNQNGDNE